MGGGVTGKILNKVMSNGKARTAVRTVVDILGEGAEEWIVEKVTPYLQRMIYNPNAADATTQELIEAFAGGAILSGLVQGGQAITGSRGSTNINSPADTTGYANDAEWNALKTAPETGAEGGTHRMSMADFANSESSVWTNVDYDDIATQQDITQKTHNEMVAEGNVVVLADSDGKVSEHFPDLRAMKRSERSGILRAKRIELKNKLRVFLQDMSKGSFEFDVNGNILEVRLYNTGINKVLSQITKDKATMLYQSEEIFAKAKYLYSMSDTDGDPDIYRWNYFYVPVEIDGDTVGVRIAVRDMIEANESQIHSWGIKREAPLADGRRTSEDSNPADSSSGASTDSIPSSPEKSNNNLQEPDPFTAAALRGLENQEQSRQAALDAATGETNSDPENHIDNRTYESVAKRSVKSFQFDNPQLHPYYAEVAIELAKQAIVDGIIDSFFEILQTRPQAPT